MQDELCYIFCCWVYMSSEDRSWAPRSSYLKRRTNHADVGIKNCPCWSLIWQHLTRVCYKNLCGAVQLFQEKLARPMQRKTIRHGPLKKTKYREPALIIWLSTGVPTQKNLFLVATNTKVLFRNRLIRLLLLPRLSSDISIVLFFFWNEFHSIILITLFRWLWWICWTLSPIRQAKRGPANCVTLLTCWAAQTIYMAIELFCHYTIGSCLDWW